MWLLFLKTTVSHERPVAPDVAGWPGGKSRGVTWYRANSPSEPAGRRGLGLGGRGNAEPLPRPSKPLGILLKREGQCLPQPGFPARFSRSTSIQDGDTVGMGGLGLAWAVGSQESISLAGMSQMSRAWAVQVQRLPRVWHGESRVGHWGARTCVGEGGTQERRAGLGLASPFLLGLHFSSCPVGDLDGPLERP